jgi:hypothetical protein
MKIYKNWNHTLFTENHGKRTEHVLLYSNYDLEEFLMLETRFLDSLLQDFAALHEGAEFGCRQSRVPSFSSYREILALYPVQCAQKEYIF